MFDMYDIDKINSMTEYPSILTYHTMGEKGCLTEETSTTFVRDDFFITEKIDGTNTRIVLLVSHGENVDYLIGSRGDILYARGDRVYNQTLGIVENLVPIAEGISRNVTSCDWYGVVIVYGELYGGKINGCKEYTKNNQFGWRLFDIAYIEMRQYIEQLKSPIQSIASWRNHGGQPFLSVSQQGEFCNNHALSCVPSLGMQLAPPSSIKEAYEYMKSTIDITHAGIGHSGKPEGIVIRNASRSKIAKLRFEDYERAIRKLKL
jgi:hypothetical protein